MAVFEATPSLASSPVASRAEELACEAGAADWARLCGWVPGTGHCRLRDCDAACIFRVQRDADARRVRRGRRRRRPSQDGSGSL
jgi:hypothetical protein